MPSTHLPFINIALDAFGILISALVTHQLNETYYIEYRESGHIDYNVFLKDNDFYDSTYLEKDQSYVASLIDKIVTAKDASAVSVLSQVFGASVE